MTLFVSKHKNYQLCLSGTIVKFSDFSYSTNDEGLITELEKYTGGDFWKAKTKPIVEANVVAGIIGSGSKEAVRLTELKRRNLKLNGAPKKNAVEVELQEIERLENSLGKIT